VEQVQERQPQRGASDYPAQRVAAIGIFHHHAQGTPVTHARHLPVEIIQAITEAFLELSIFLIADDYDTPVRRHQFDALAEAGELVEYVVQVDRDLVFLQRGRDDDFFHRDALAEVQAIDLPGPAYALHVNLEAAVDVELHFFPGRMPVYCADTSFHLPSFSCAT
jgi:hypothetical protein